jgi:ketosteroid isomerase-like protein
MTTMTATLAAMVLAAGAPDELSATLKKVIEANAEAMNREDLEGAMKTIHPKSMNFESTKSGTENIFKTYDLRYAMLSYSFVGSDGEYATARVKQTTKKVAGPAFRDNTLEMMHVFRKDGASWKIWTSAVLEVSYQD